VADRQPSAWPHDVPDARELVGAVRDYLAEDLGPAQEGRHRWLARVAANALAIAARELELGASHAEAHRRRLDRLGCSGDGALGAAIRAGDFDRRWAELGEVLAATVLDKLAVANPGHRDPALEPERFD
jgi:hypothetical protein